MSDNIQRGDDAGEASQPQRKRRLWQSFARALDQYLAYHVYQAISERALHRSKRQVDRYRRLMLRNDLAPSKAPVAAVRRGAPAMRPKSS